jgi:hypothetical protein
MQKRKACRPANQRPPKPTHHPSQLARSDRTQRRYGPIKQSRPTTQSGQFEHNRDTSHHGTSRFDQLRRRTTGTPSSQYVINDHDALARPQQPIRQLQAGRPVLQPILHPMRNQRRLTRLTHRHHPNTGRITNRRTQQEPTRLDRHHRTHIRRQPITQGIRQRTKRRGIGEHRTQIAEQHTRLRKVRNLPNQRQRIVQRRNPLGHVQRFRLPVGRPGLRFWDAFGVRAGTLAAAA